jgi:putative transposase
MRSFLAEKGNEAGYEKVRRWMRLANIRPIQARKYLSQLGKQQYIYPYCRAT